ncbi:BrnT family toxin (plasmid) [Methylobacterium currus]|uniref:BrnT family toxin n=1 Tax=Methylobacterium currus TaxID=2051553 RepID=UPI001E47AF57|nr:BrnT family toxin [Methylobacterium currus]UHC20008.1 BrnT family toxin [Methylobacterium currus]
MEFDYDPAKDAKVRAERGFGFAEAVAIFAGRVVEYQDQRQDYGEVRMVAVGQAGGVFYTVVYTDRGSIRHIITAWPSNRKERKVWLASA